MDKRRNFVDSCVHYFCQNRFAVVMTVVYALVVIVLSCCHEVWRDEIEPLSLVAGSRSLADLMVNIRDY